MCRRRRCQFARSCSASAAMSGGDDIHREIVGIEDDAVIVFGGLARDVAAYDILTDALWIALARVAPAAAPRELPRQHITLLQAKPGNLGGERPLVGAAGIEHSLRSPSRFCLEQTR